MSVSPRLAASSGIVRDYDGSRPCLPPEVLAKVAAKALLRVRVAKDEAEEEQGAQ